MILIERMRLQLQVAEMRYFWRETNKFSRFEVLRHPGGAWSSAATPSHRKEQEVFQASDEVASKIFLFGGFLGLWNWEKEPMVDP